MWAYLSWLTHTAGSLTADVLNTSPQPGSFAIWLLTWKYIFFLSTARAVDSGSFKTYASEVFRGIRCPVFSEGVSGVLLSRHLSESNLTRSDMPLKPHMLDLHVLHPAHSFSVEQSSARSAVSVHLSPTCNPKVCAQMLRSQKFATSLQGSI